MHCLRNMNTSQNQTVYSTFLQPKNASVSLLIVGLFQIEMPDFPTLSYILELIKSLLFYIQSNTALHLIVTDSLLCPWGKKVLTFSLNPTHLIRTLSMALLVFGINGVWLYLKPEKDTPSGGASPYRPLLGVLPPPRPTHSLILHFKA